MGLFDFFRKKPAKEEKKIQPPLETNQTQSKQTISVTFEMPTSSDNYKYPWDESRPSANDDFSNVNFLRIFEKPRSLSDDPDEFGRSVSYHLHIYDPIKRRNELLDMGYLRVTAPAETLTTYKVPELKAILKNAGLTTTGKKVDLINRIVLSIDIPSLNLPNMCCISDKGIDFVNRNQDLVKLASNPYSITYDEYIATKNKLPDYLNYNDIIWSVFARREMFSGGNYNIRSLNAYNRARFLMAENRHSGALEYFLYALYFEMNDPSRVIPDDIKEYYADDEIVPSQVTSSILEPIFQLQEHFSEDLIDRCYARIDVPKILIAKKDFARLIDDIFAGNFIDVRNYLPKGLR